MDSRKLARLCLELADSKKAENLVILDVRKLTSVTDYFVIGTGTSEPHLRAIVDEITDGVREQCDLRPRNVDGGLETSWVVLDFSSVIIHIMKEETRQHYDLETLWSDAPRVRPRRKPSPMEQLSS